MVQFLPLPYGKIRLELYRLSYLANQRVARLALKHRHSIKLALASALLAVIPAMGPSQSNIRFPETEKRVNFARAAYPVAVIQSEVRITPGESLSQEYEREQASTNVTKKTSVSESLRFASYSACPESFRPFYQEVSVRFGVPWQIIEAIHQVETGKSCHTARRSYAGAVGPMQFLPSTWRRYQWDCTGDGVADITNAYDAICTGAHYIGTGLSGFSLERSIYSYNKSWAYVDKVMRIAREIGYEG